MSRALQAIRAGIGEDLNPESINAACRDADRVRARIEDEFQAVPLTNDADARVGDSGELWSATGILDMSPSRVLQVGEDPNITFPGAEILLDRILWPLLYAHGVVIPSRLELTIVENLGHPWALGPILHYYSVLAPLLDAHVIREIEVPRAAGGALEFQVARDTDDIENRLDVKFSRSSGFPLWSTPSSSTNNQVLEEPEPSAMSDAAMRKANLNLLREDLWRTFFAIQLLESMGSRVQIASYTQTSPLVVEQADEFTLAFLLDQGLAQAGISETARREHVRLTTLVRETVPVFTDLSVGDLLTIRADDTFNEWRQFLAQVLLQWEVASRLPESSTEAESTARELLGSQAAKLKKATRRSRVLEARKEGLAGFGTGGVSAVLTSAMLGSMPTVPTVITGGAAESLVEVGVGLGAVILRWLRGNDNVSGALVRCNRAVLLGRARVEGS
jgi:hypothetical protein